MRSPLTAVAIVAVLALAAGAAPATARAAGNKVKRPSLSIKRNSPKRAARPPVKTRLKNFFLRPLRRLQPISRQQHPYAPVKAGDTRVFEIAKPGGESSLVTQEVSAVRIQDGRLRAQISQTFESDGHSSTTHHVQDVTTEGMLMATAEKLDHPPAVPITVSGVALPRKMSPGQTWKSSMSWQQGGATIEHRSQGRVLRKVRMAGPDRVMRDGVEIETVSHSTTTQDGTPSRSKQIQRGIYLKGLGEVENTIRTEGTPGSMTRRLVGFTPGGDPG